MPGLSLAGVSYPPGKRVQGLTAGLNSLTWKPEKAFEEELIRPFIPIVKEKDEIFPWDHIDIGVTRSFYGRMAEGSQKEITPDCRVYCSGCGVKDSGGNLQMNPIGIYQGKGKIYIPFGPYEGHAGQYAGQNCQ